MYVASNTLEPISNAVHKHGNKHLPTFRGGGREGGGGHQTCEQDSPPRARRLRGPFRPRRRSSNTTSGFRELLTVGDCIPVEGAQTVRLGTGVVRNDVRGLLKASDHILRHSRRIAVDLETFG
jgi:hypothetical protein